MDNPLKTPANRLSKAETVRATDYHIDTQQPPTAVNHCGIIWEGPLDADGRSVLAECLFWRASRPSTNEFDLLLMPEHGSGVVCFANGHQTRFGRTPTASSGSSILIPAGMTYWVLPDLSIGWPFRCRMVTWPRFKRDDSESSPRLDHIDNPDPDGGNIRDAWVRSMREQHNNLTRFPTASEDELRDLDVDELLRRFTTAGMESMPQDLKEIRAGWYDLDGRWQRALMGLEVDDEPASQVPETMIEGLEGADAYTSPGSWRPQMYESEK